MHLDIKTEITALLDRVDADFLPVKKIVQLLPDKIIHDLGINASPRPDSQVAMVEKLQKAFGSAFGTYRNSRGTKFIGFPLSTEELIIHALEKQPGISSKKLRLSLPMTEPEFITELNRLFETGSIFCTSVYKSHIISGLRVSENTSSNGMTPGEKKDAFQTAYLSIGGGRPYVMIHDLRRKLGWSVTEFNQVLIELSKNGVIELQTGDTSSLTEQELTDSYLDRLGYLLLSVSWRE